jgi:hypothetical protein
LLAELQWIFIPEQDFPSKSITRKRPDYCLFLNDQSRQRAAKEPETADVFREAATVMEAKKVEHSLDKVSENEPDIDHSFHNPEGKLLNEASAYYYFNATNRLRKPTVDTKRR